MSITFDGDRAEEHPRRYLAMRLHFALAGRVEDHVGRGPSSCPEPPIAPSGTLSGPRWSCRRRSRSTEYGVGKTLTPQDLSAWMRRPYIDWLRGLAVLIMMEWHALDAWTAADSRGTEAFRVAALVGGWAAPLVSLSCGRRDSVRRPLEHAKGRPGPPGGRPGHPGARLAGVRSRPSLPVSVLSVRFVGALVVAVQARHPQHSRAGFGRRGVLLGTSDGAPPRRLPSRGSRRHHRAAHAVVARVVLADASPSETRGVHPSGREPRRLHTFSVDCVCLHRHVRRAPHFANPDRPAKSRRFI